MQQINLQPIPSQTLLYLDGQANQWEIGVRLTKQSIAFTFRVNGTLLMENVTAVAGFKIIPYEYLSSSNFVLVTQNREIPDYTQFGITQFLIALSPEEVEAIKAPIYSLGVITSDSFDPRGGLPLRFKPQGYVLA